VPAVAPVVNQSIAKQVTCLRAVECGKWPPPFDEDPDRKASGPDQ
jgi:hypothetical protein